MLRRHVVERTIPQALVRFDPPPRHRQIEVGDFRFGIVTVRQVQQDVAGLDIKMQKTAGMHVLDAFSRLQQQANGVLKHILPVLDQL